MPPQQPQLDINQLRSDPDFQGLAPGEQHKVLSKAFPDYAALPGQEQGAVMDRLTGRNQAQPAGLPAGTSLPGFSAPPNPMAKNLAWYDPMNQPASSAPDAGSDPTAKPAPGTGFRGAAGSDISSAYHQAMDFANEPIGEKAKRVGGSLLGAIPAAFRGGADMLRRQGEDQAKAIAESAQGHTLSALKNSALSYIEPASEMLGGDPDDARQRYQNGDVGGAAWELLGKPALLAAASEAGARAMTGMTSLVGGPIEGARANDAFASWISGGVKSGAPQETAAAVRPLFKQAAANVGLRDEDGIQRMFAGDTPSRGPGITANKQGIRKTVQGMKKGIEVADEAVRLADAPMQAVINQAANDIVPQPVKDNIIQGIKAKSVAAREVGNDSLANAYDTIAKTVGEKKTYGELNGVKQNANQQTEGMGGKGSPSEQVAAAVKPVQAWRDTGDLIRNNMYPELQQRYIPQPGQTGYFDVRAMGQREAQVLDARDGIYKGYDQAAHLDAPHGAKNMTEKASEGSMYKTHVLKRITGIEPSPAGKFNVMMRRGIGEIGTGGTPESVSVLPKSADIAKITSTPEFKAMSPDAQRDYLAKMTPKGMQPRLPAPPGYAQFDVPTPGTPETTQGPGVVSAQRNYLGTEAAQNPGYQPITGPSWVQQHQQLGSTADTIPNSVRGVQSPARMRADQLGLGHMTPPPTTPGSNLQGHTLNPVDMTKDHGSYRVEVKGPKGDDKGYIQAEVNPDGTYSISHAGINEESRGKGIGSAAYKKLINDLSAKGHAVTSDWDRSPAAESVWKKLAKEGMAEEKPAPPTMIRASDGTRVRTPSGSTVYVSKPISPSFNSLPSLSGVPSPPIRSITGEPNITRSKWQYVSAPNEATQTVDRGTRGVFRTNDPMQAQSALEAMDRHMQSDSFKNLDKQTQFETRAAAEKLRNQLESHTKVQNSPRPPEFEVHWDPGNPAKLRGRRVGIGRRIAANSVRSLVQSTPGQLTPPPYSQQDVDSEQQLMSQPQ